VDPGVLAFEDLKIQDFEPFVRQAPEGPSFFAGSLEGVLVGLSPRWLAQAIEGTIASATRIPDGAHLSRR
jgi:hypothetical protein